MLKTVTSFISFAALLVASVASGWAAGVQNTPDVATGIGLHVSSRKVLELPVQPPRVLKLDLTRNANDVWDRIRRGFSIPDYDSQLVGEMQAFYLNRPRFLHQVFERASPYLYYIVDEIERRGLPTELALLPMIESSYNPFAYSPSQAAGLWQFIPSTGRNFNLTQDKWVDERRDIIASTTAALDYLEYIYEMHGDWQLALAAYNSGEGAVGRAIKANQSKGLPIDFDHLNLTAQAKRYLPKLQAIKNIVARPELFDFDLPYIPNDQHFTSIKVPKGLGLTTAADMADMPFEEFIALNPGYKLPAITRDDDELIVPTDRSDAFQLKLSQGEDDALHWRMYQMKAGDTLTSVAKKFGLSLLQLQQLNGLSRNSKVGVSHTLLVPRGSINPEKAMKATRMLSPR